VKSIPFRVLKRQSSKFNQLLLALAIGSIRNGQICNQLVFIDCQFYNLLQMAAKLKMLNSQFATIKHMAIMMKLKINAVLH